ncbi:hypothetical protein HRR83_006106 [Exophiala dermatitidis]|uniref:Uncharacterized protein n=2 Tax=Exophiala dermatitidis TaxID=5970 RepID=A0AAN6EQG5_EXODE|nr:hypothetical protein HRR75_005046 [Exophiala dermatitidis]KAJ4515038.1 hypothetical protein HRR74_005503 [Exophiala dermatitidis]KAJ4517529.1 hypothetical protein HRR73_004581 [Exophiala dermatitidis]KAJ4548714.1 hypothetical protein HRR76_001298 [Exophiala dermatitidis]KAJ4552567.1 hypothetical protein HRR77_002572 [Exophiala dermatitidis]
MDYIDHKYGYDIHRRGYDDDDDDYGERDYYDDGYRDASSDASESSLVRVRRRLTRAERYRKPTNVIEVDLKSIDGGATFDPKAPAREATEHRLDRLTLIRQRHHFEAIEWRKILSIRRYVNQDRRETALVTSQISPAGRRKDDFEFEWIHLKAKHPRLHDVLNFVAALDSVHPDERSLATILLRKAVEDHEQSHSWGKFLENRVDRCDGHRGSEPDKWAIFLSIHHLHAAPLPHDSSVDPGSHHSRTLFEYHYMDQENTMELDTKQLLRQASQFGEILHVHNLWLLLLSSGTLITISPNGMDDCLGPAVVIEDITNQSFKAGLQLVRFLDPTDRQFFVPSAQCETWFAMMDKVVGLCGNVYGDDPQRYHITAVDGVEVTASEWQHFFTSQDGFCATVRISLSSTTPPPPTQLSAGSDRSSITSSGSYGRRDLIRSRRDDSPSYRRPRRRSPRGHSRHRERVVIEARRSKEDKEAEQAMIEKMNQEIEREVASVLQPNHDPASRPSADIPENVATLTSPMQATSAEEEYKGILSTYRTDSPPPMDTTSSEHRTHHSRTPVRRRGTRGTTAESSTPVVRRTMRTSTHVSDSAGRRRENPLTLVVYETEGASRARETSTTMPRRSMGTGFDRISSLRAVDPAVGDDREGNRRAGTHRDTRSNEERERSIKRRRENPVYRVDVLPHIITNKPLHAGKSDHIFYLPKEVFDSAIGRSGVDEGQGSEVVSERNQEVGINAASTPAPRSDKLVAEFSHSQEAKTSAKVVEDKAFQQPPTTRWKTGGHKMLPPTNMPPPVFLWQTGNPVDKSPVVSPPAEYGSVPKNNKSTIQEPQDWQVLNLILSQINLSLTRGSRISVDTVEKLQEKEAPIYKLIQESSLEAVEAAYSRLNPPPAADQNPASSDIVERIGLCLEILKELIDFFLPHGYPSIVLGKFWGGVALWLQQLEKMVSAESGQESRHIRQGGRLEYPLDAFYVVNAELAPRNPQDPALKLPDRPVEECSDCIRRRAHADINAIVLHLNKVHFQHTEVTDEQLQPWIRKGDKVDGFQLRCDAKRLVDTVLDHCTHLRVLKDEIISGVCGSGKFDSVVYRLPNGLVRAFERILTMMAYSGYAASVSVREYHASPVRFRRFFESTYQNHIVELGYAAEGSFDEAKSNLMLMSRVSEYSNSIQFDTVGPEYMVLLLLSGLQDRGSNRNPLCLPKLHRKEMNRLLYEVHHHPRRRLLQEIRLLETEVKAIETIREDFYRVVEDYAGMLASNGFKKTTTTRRSLYRDFERRLADKIMKDNRQDERDSDVLLRAADVLCIELTQAVEIQQEDHGKAILVFTIVTIIFLPMSLVTGFLGMNTADLRNLHSGQWIFWAAAVPLTCAVVGVTVWIGYRGESLSRWLWLWKANRGRRQLQSTSWLDRRSHNRKVKQTKENKFTDKATAAEATEGLSQSYRTRSSRGTHGPASVEGGGFLNV